VVAGNCEILKDAQVLLLKSSTTTSLELPHFTSSVCLTIAFIIEVRAHQVTVVPISALTRANLLLTPLWNVPVSALANPAAVETTEFVGVETT